MVDTVDGAWCAGPYVVGRYRRSWYRSRAKQALVANTVLNADGTREAIAVNDGNGNGNGTSGNDKDGDGNHDGHYADEN